MFEPCLMIDCFILFQPAEKMAVELSLALAEGNPVQEGSARPESWNARPATFINPENQQRHIAQKLGLPDNILPDDDRNDLYVTIQSGMFEKGDKFRDRSIEVQVFLRILLPTNNLSRKDSNIS